MKWKQREKHVPLGDSDTTEYRYCLYALIATISDVDAEVADLVYHEDYGLRQIEDALERAEERAADLAHRLFEKWIEVEEPLSFRQQLERIGEVPNLLDAENALLFGFDDRDMTEDELRLALRWVTRRYTKDIVHYSSS